MKKVVTTRHVDFGLRTLDDNDARGIKRWFARLSHWDEDERVRKRTLRLKGLEDMYMLKANKDYRIFFQLEKDTITIHDIATQRTIEIVGRVRDGD